MPDFSRSTGYRCPSCCAKSGDAHTAECKGDPALFASFSIDCAGVWMFGPLPPEALDQDGDEQELAINI